MLVFRHPRTGQLWEPSDPGQRALLVRHGWVRGVVRPVSVIEYLNGLRPEWLPRPSDFAACRVCWWTWGESETFIAARTHVRMSRHTVDLTVGGLMCEPLTWANTSRRRVA